MLFFPILITFLVCYFLGNHNGAICVSMMMGDDVRSHGSGNAGLTNYIRNFGAASALFVAVTALSSIIIRSSFLK